MQTIRDTYRFRHVLFALTAKELKAQYRNMSLGFLWALLNPLVMVTVLSAVFVWFMGAGLEHPSRVVVGLIPYNLISYCVTGCAGSILRNASLVKKVRFPRQILPYSVILTHLVHFAIQSTLIVAVLLIFPTPGHPLTLHLVWLPAIFVVQVGLCVGAGMLVSALNVVFRDTTYIVSSLMMVLFWLSPVIYDARERFDASGEPWSWIQVAYFLNPVASLIDSYRCVLFHGRSPDLLVFTMGLVVTLVIGVIGMRVFWKFEREFAELVQ